MKITRGYYKTEIAGVPYLLSYGQEHAQRGICIQLNYTGSLLWDALCAGADEAGMLQVLADEFAAAKEDLPLLREDIRQYKKQLCMLGILTEEEPVAVGADAQRFFRIGPLTIAYDGAPELFETYFAPFSCEKTAEATLSFVLRCDRPAHCKNGTILVRTRELMICDCGEDYGFVFFGDWGIHEMHVRKDGARAVVYCVPHYEQAHGEDVFHALRFAFLVAAQQHGIIVVHSASLLYRDRAWLFSGSSGTGKSTHTALWERCFQTPLLNGDLNAIGIEDGSPVVYGLPWCGTSGIATPRNYPLGGIVFLRQAQKNQVQVPSADAGILLLLQRLISPSWTQALCEKNLRLAQQIADHTRLFTLACTKEKEAASVMRKAVDAALHV